MRSAIAVVARAAPISRTATGGADLGGGRSECHHPRMSGQAQTPSRTLTCARRQENLEFVACVWCSGNQFEQRESDRRSELAGLSALGPDCVKSQDHMSILLLSLRFVDGRQRLFSARKGSWFLDCFH